MWKALVAILLAFLALCTFLPVLIRVEVRREGPEIGCIGTISPLAGLLGIGVRLLPGPSRILLLLCGRRLVSFGFPERRGPSEPSSEKPEEKAPRRTYRGIRGAISRAMALFRRFRLPVRRFLRRTMKAFSLRRLRCDLGFGTGSPVWTGQIFGWCQALRGMIGKRIEMELRPDFRETMFEGTLSICLGLRPYVVLMAAFLSGSEVAWTWMKDRFARARR